ncbi:MAG: hypothetical protein ABI182_06465, partial [Candidatus Baltobacteraceae bacterium]
MADILSISASGMQAQRAVLDVAARNVAAAEAAGQNGSYEREVPIFQMTRDTIDGDDGNHTIAFKGTRLEKGSNVDILTEMISVM